MEGAQMVVAVDTKVLYKEIEVGELTAREHVWDAPYLSDWAIAVGNFSSLEQK
jgi:hypothetical protein